MKKLRFLLSTALVLGALTTGAFAGWNAPVVLPTSSQIVVDGTNRTCEAYNIGGSNYFKLRDIATLVNGTEKTFAVDFDGATKSVMLTSNEKYVANGTEMAKGDGQGKTATWSDQSIYLDGEKIYMDAYNIAGSNYVKLRDVCVRFDIGLTWDGAKNTIAMNTEKDYLDGGKTIDTGYIAFELPAHWEGKYNVSYYAGSVSFVEKISEADGYGGYMFSYHLDKSLTAEDFYYNCQLLGTLETAEGTYYVCVAGPTDVQFSPNGEANYTTMYGDKIAVNNSLRAAEGCVYTPIEDADAFLKDLLGDDYAD